MILEYSYDMRSTSQEKNGFDSMETGLSYSNSIVFFSLSFLIFFFYKHIKLIWDGMVEKPLFLLWLSWSNFTVKSG